MRPESKIIIQIEEVFKRKNNDQEFLLPGKNEE